MRSKLQEYPTRALRDRKVGTLAYFSNTRLNRKGTSR
jgi:hypothetical protein